LPKKFWNFLSSTLGDKIKGYDTGRIELHALFKRAKIIENITFNEDTPSLVIKKAVDQQAKHHEEKTVYDFILLDLAYRQSRSLNGRRQ